MDGSWRTDRQTMDYGLGQLASCSKGVFIVTYIGKFCNFYC